MEPDRQPLLSLVDSVSDGHAVDWDGAEAGAKGAEEQVNVRIKDVPLKQALKNLANSSIPPSTTNTT